MITRRFFSLGMLAAPVIIRTPGLIMPIKPALLVDPQIVTLNADFKITISKFVGRLNIGDTMTFGEKTYTITALASPSS